MNVRPAPHTYLELKQRLAEEQAFYEQYGDHFAPLSALRAVVSPLADALESLSRTLRSLAAVDEQSAI